MSKKIELVHAEVVTLYKSNEVLREFKIEKGSVFSFNVKTKVNDKSEKSPVIFDSCSIFADNDEKKQFIRNTIQAGAILDIKGYHDRKKGKNKEGKDTYYDNINVKDIVLINNDSVSNEDESYGSNAQTNDENLPF